MVLLRCTASTYCSTCIGRESLIIFTGFIFTKYLKKLFTPIRYNYSWCGNSESILWNINRIEERGIETSLIRRGIFALDHNCRCAEFLHLEKSKSCIVCDRHYINSRLKCSFTHRRVLPNQLGYNRHLVPTTVVISVSNKIHSKLHIRKYWINWTEHNGIQLINIPIRSKLTRERFFL